ncbi:precorrin-6A reductase [Vibrio viridaestus]|uniref:Precorrin-6A reductase n=1 Tax=Vibrio viridaestus TaxID=2487322 RepID=A0A3N9U4K7_9VIBR|nr:precorrin-6A reductase [Vibrio viridaestus]RQW64552.1 precorrin-6A reductase [Vibrio viridaestus]
MTITRVAVFGGTSDSNTLCTWLRKKNIPFELSVATDSGKEMAQRVTSDFRIGRLGPAAMIEWLKRGQFSLVIDASHPYAMELHKTIVTASQAMGLPTIRLERSSDISDEIQKAANVYWVNSPEQACELANQLHCRSILLTTGSKDLKLYRNSLQCNKLYARVLPNTVAVELCANVGFSLDEIIALKGPFSQSFNAALYQELGIELVITKESGQAGGFVEKVTASIDSGVLCIVIRRPQQDALVYDYTVFECNELESIVTKYIN